MDTTINLTDCSYPIHIKKDLDTLEGLSYLGQLKSKIKVDLKLEKISSKIFFVKGHVSSSFKTECQKCLKLMDIQLKTNTEVTIKDKSEEQFDLNNPDEIHYQDIFLFNINKLILEEINLNFPTVVVCCSSESINKKKSTINRKIQPFKKIGDLIK